MSALEVRDGPKAGAGTKKPLLAGAADRNIVPVFCMTNQAKCLTKIQGAFSFPISPYFKPYFGPQKRGNGNSRDYKTGEVPLANVEPYSPTCMAQNQKNKVW